MSGMRAQVIAAACSVASLLAGVAVPIAFPHVQPWVGYVLFGAAMCLAVLAAGLWWPNRKDMPQDGTAFTTHGLNSPGFSGFTVGGDFNYGTTAQAQPERRREPIRDQIGVVSGALFMWFGEWDHQLNELSAEDEIRLFAGKFGQMIQDAVNGDLDIWVRRDRHSGPHINPGSDFWENHHFDWVSDESVIIVRATDGGHLPKAYEPLVRKSDMERLYGPSFEMIIV